MKSDARDKYATNSAKHLVGMDFAVVVKSSTLVERERVLIILYLMRRRKRRTIAIQPG
jgi:hypothetical protein